jgi:hypothetical protein
LSRTCRSGCKAQVKSIGGPAVSCTGDVYQSREMRSTRITFGPRSGGVAAGDFSNWPTRASGFGPRRKRLVSNVGQNAIPESEFYRVTVTLDTTVKERSTLAGVTSALPIRIVHPVSQPHV